MVPMRAFLGICAIASFAWLSSPAAADDDFPVIFQGKVTMEDGSPPPFTVGIERICSDNNGSAPGPITNKKGEYVWRMLLDPFKPRSCFIQATHAGYTSTNVEISGVNTSTRSTTATLAPLVISATAPDPYRIQASEGNIPSKAKGPFSAAMKALDESNFQETGKQLEAAVAAAPKFAQAWHALGIVDEKRLNKPKEAKEAYQHAIEADPKLLTAYVTLTRVCLKTKDWNKASETADALIKADAKRIYPEIYLHRAVAQYELKDLAGAETSIQEAIRLDPNHKRPREEYVLGRILEAKGDGKGASEHMAKYLELDPGAGDVDVVKAHFQNLGKGGAGQVEPELEP